MRTIKNLLKISSYFLYLFLILEIISRIALANPKFFTTLHQGDYIADPTWRLSWIKRQEKKGQISDDYSIHDPIQGWKLKPNTVIPDAFYGKPVSINSKGVRSTSEFSYKKDPTRTRILIFGDSFTFGSEVGDDETYSAFLQKLIPQADVINMGVHGYGYDQMLLHLKQEGTKYQPDIVIVGIISVDNNRSMLGFRDYAKPMFVLKKNKLKLTKVPIPSPEKMYQLEFFKSKFMDLLKILNRNIKVKRGEYLEEEKKINEAIHREMVRTIHSMSATPMFLYLDGMRDPIKKKETDNQFSEFANQWFDEGVYSIYPLPYLKMITNLQLEALGLNDKPVVIKRTHGHYSPRENSIIAFAIKDFLSKQKLIK